ncbi:MBL fold metallo-hydrolase [Halorubrum ezzemoulense]|uniref:MBL fold metallo-hydrolase n=1 Tax=Halorubrum ezzemoulense TaxID=337243 RepID=UPI00232D4292|nr:MBL fold metallo-hydrolase [Halorubrum ezzemoulense]MDB2282051.1 MBL fold metallo-hydrolase [Halorubrum ezzemoulense]MDB9279350.1 MBL fold metallo-hydrolase [Halorubrum ezzemoulense]MDB9282872.1 MBL fold metallo-hydrolase [Halorubrum ezzemoulense]
MSVDDREDPDRLEGPAVTRVEVPVDTRAPGGTTNAYLLDGLLADPAARTDALDAALAERGSVDADAPSVEAIAVTHAHPDHVGAVADYAALTGATVVAREGHAERFAAATGVEPDETVAPGETVADTAVRAVDTPGHAPDHLAFAAGGPGTESGRSVLCCGDLAVAEGSVAVAAPEGDLAAYLASLERVRDAGYDRLLPGHGPPIDDPPAACERLIDHRLDRERDVIAALDGGASDLDAVVDGAYEKDLSGVRDLALATVAAHVEKLVAEGRADEAWRARLADRGFD